MNENETRDYLERMFDSQVETVRELLTAAYAGDDEASEELDNLPYGATINTQVYFVLAGGGPSAGVMVTLNGTDEVLDVEWQGSWAGPTITRKLSEDDGGLGEWAASEAIRMVESR